MESAFNSSSERMTYTRYQSIETAPAKSVALGGARIREVPMRRPRLLMVGMHLTLTRGGITTLTADILASRLSDEYEISYISSQAEQLGTVRKLMLAAKALSQFVGKCLTKRFDAAYIHVGSNASLYRESAFIILGRLFRLPLIVHFHAGDLTIYLEKQNRLGRAFISKAIGCASKAIAVSYESGHSLQELTPETRVSVVPNAIETSRFLSITRSEAKTSDEKVVRILFVGAIGKLKGERDLIDALVKLNDPCIRFSILGFGAESLNSLPQFSSIAEQVEQLGPIPMADRYDHFRRADIFVLPTYAEAMPISVIEAMAAGLPTVTTRVGGIPEIIDDRIEGLLYDAGDTDQLAECISKLVSNMSLRIEMGRKARERVRKQMCFDKYIGDLQTEITAVMEGNV